MQEDLDIRQLIRDEMGQAGISKIEIERFPKRVSLTIWTAKPGIIIGRKGANVRALRQNLEELSNKKVTLMSRRSSGLNWMLISWPRT